MTTLKIHNVTEANKYAGAYAKIFSVINADRLFVEIYEADDSIGFVGSDYILTLSESLDCDVLAKVLTIKNVTT